MSSIFSLPNTSNPLLTPYIFDLFTQLFANPSAPVPTSHVPYSLETSISLLVRFSLPYSTSQLLILTPISPHTHFSSEPLLLTTTSPHTHFSSLRFSSLISPQPRFSGPPAGCCPNLRVAVPSPLLASAAGTLTRRRGHPRSCCSTSGTSWF